MAQTANFILIDQDQRSEIVFSFAHHRSGALRVLVPTEVEKQFFEDILLNINAGRLVFSTFEEYSNATQAKEESIFVISAPNTFQIVQSILAKAHQFKQSVYFIILKKNKKYLKMLTKKIGVVAEVLQFSSNKFVGINDKLRELVDKSYDLNRAAFYAYGAFINYFRANLLKKIFRTDQLDVAKLARSFGFTTPPRVKEGKFLTPEAQKEKKKEKAKKSKKRVESTDKNETDNVETVQPVGKQPTKVEKKVKTLKVKKIKKEKLKN